MPTSLLDLPDEPILLVYEKGTSNLAHTDNHSSTAYIFTYALRSTCNYLHALIPPPKSYSFDDATRNLPPRTKGDKLIRSIKRAHTENMLAMERWRCYYAPTPAILKDLDDSLLKPWWFAEIVHDQVQPQFRDKLPPRSLHFCRLCQKLRATESFAIPHITGLMAKERLPCKKRVLCDVRQESPLNRYCIDCLMSIAYVDVWSPDASPVHHEYNLSIDTVNNWGGAEASVERHLRCVACTACLGSIDAVYDEEEAEVLGDLAPLLDKKDFRRLAMTRYAKSKSKFDSCKFRRVTGGFSVHKCGVLTQTSNPITLVLGVVFDMQSTGRIDPGDIKESRERLLRHLISRLQHQSWVGRKTAQRLFVHRRSLEKLNMLPWTQTK